MNLNTLKTIYMVRTRPAGDVKTFNIYYQKAFSKQDALNAIKLSNHETIIDVLQPGEEAYGLSKQDIKTFFRKK